MFYPFKENKDLAVENNLLKRKIVELTSSSKTTMNDLKFKNQILTELVSILKKVI